MFTITTAWIINTTARGMTGKPRSGLGWRSSVVGFRAWPDARFQIGQNRIRVGQCDFSPQDTETTRHLNMACPHARTSPRRQR
jgi:hypothetical protein